jgi:hypothetical protein
MFVFHDLDLELSLPLFSFWLKNHIVFVVFMPMTFLGLLDYNCTQKKVEICGKKIQNKHLF